MRTSRMFALLAVVTIAVAPVQALQKAGPAPRLDTWRILGPGGGGTMVAPTISPHDSRLVVEHCDMTGAYITTDGALSWRMFNLRAGITTFAFDPKDPKVIYGANAALWRSEDTGKTWRMVFPDPAKSTAEHTWSDHAEYVLTTGDQSYPASGKDGEIQAIAIDPTDSNRIFVAMAGAFLNNDPALLLSSTDRGKSWTRVAEIGAGRVFAASVVGSAVFVASESGVFILDGDRTDRRPAPEGRKIVMASIGRDPKSPSPTVYATTETGWNGKQVAGGVYVSRDGGATWRVALDGLTTKLYQPGEGRPPRFEAVACSERHPEVAYVGFRGLPLGEGAAGRYSGIAKTTNAGASWTIVHQESNRPSPNLEPSWIETRSRGAGRDIWFDAPYSLGVAPADPNVCYATDLFRTYRTTDGGRKWQQVTSVRAGADGWTSRGLDVTTCYGVHFDPFDPKRIFVSYTDIGMFRSEDGGESWVGSTVGVPDAWRNTTYWVAFDPAVRGKMWAAFSGTHDLPRPKMWRTRSSDSFKGGVGVSVDGGRTWQLSNGGLPETAVTHIVLDAASPVDRRVLYAACYGRGVFKSIDGGKTWTPKNEGITQTQPFAWRLTQSQDGSLYVVVARRSERGKIGDADDGALYRSTDAGEHWTKVALPEGTNGPMGLTVDPRDPNRLYLSAWGVARQEGDTGGGVFVSTDRGVRWRKLFDRSQHVYDLTIDPGDPKTLYIGTFDAAVYRSLDAGETWSPVRGYNFKWGHRVIPDPTRPGMIYVTTFGGSVWHGPAAGDPNAGGDTVPLSAGA